MTLEILGGLFLSSGIAYLVYKKMKKPVPVPVIPTVIPPEPKPPAKPVPPPIPIKTKAETVYTTSGNQILENGKPFRIIGINWFGFETHNLLVHGLWQNSYKEMLAQIKTLGFNTIRIPFTNKVLWAGERTEAIDVNLNPDLAEKTPIQCLDIIINAATSIGLRVILDRHAPTPDQRTALWYTDEVSEDKWIRDWMTLAARYKDVPRFLGCDLHNEPHDPATWDKWATSAQVCGNNILDVNPNVLIIVEGIQTTSKGSYWWGGNLGEASTRPIILSSKNKVLYSAHDYPQSVYTQEWFGVKTYPKNLRNIWDRYWGYLHRIEAAPVLLGEFGTKLETESDKQWFQTICQYLKDNELSFTFWCLNPNSGDTGGILKADWKSVEQEKLEILKSAF